MTRGTALALLMIAIGGGTAVGQTPLAPAVVKARRQCDGDTITSINIQSYPPSYTGRLAATQRTASGWLRMSHTTTRPAIIAAYMRLVSGRICTELDRSESERLLRAQPFIASATIRAIPDGPRRVRLQVDVVDELRLVIGASVRREGISSLLLGTENLGGRGLSLSVSERRGFAYRDGFGLQGVKYGMFGRPDFLAVEAERRPVIGERLLVELAEPFLTDLQRRAYHLSSGLSSGYTTLMRPTGDKVSLFVRRTSYDAGVVTRLGRANGRGPVGLFGAVVLGEDVRTGTDLVVVSDTGLITEPTNPFATKYPAYTTTRIAAVAGLRALRFVTVSGFDAISAEQDFGIGAQFDFLAGPSVQSSRGTEDMFVATDLYLGAGTQSSFFAARALAEMRGERRSRRWDGLVGSARLAWYGKVMPERTTTATIEFAATQRLPFPMQLSFRDPDGGLPGYGRATLVGGQRMVARVGERWLVTALNGRADVALGAFATAGQLWAGDAPYGTNTPLLGAAGFSLSSALPAGGRRTVHLEVAFPFDQARARGKAEVRLSYSDRTRRQWTEPSDLARARTGAVPVSLMKW